MYIFDIIFNAFFFIKCVVNSEIIPSIYFCIVQCIEYFLIPECMLHDKLYIILELYFSLQLIFHLCKWSCLMENRLILVFDLPNINFIYAVQARQLGHYQIEMLIENPIDDVFNEITYLWISPKFVLPSGSILLKSKEPLHFLFF